MFAFVSDEVVLVKFTLQCFVLVHTLLIFLPLLALVPHGSALCLLYVGVTGVTQATSAACLYLRSASLASAVKHRENLKIINLFQFSFNTMGRGSAVGVTTRYWLHGPGSWYGRNFPHPFRPVLGPTQPPVQWVTALFPPKKTAGAWRWPPISI